MKCGIETTALRRQMYFILHINYPPETVYMPVCLCVSLNPSSALTLFNRNYPMYCMLSLYCYLRNSECFMSVSLFYVLICRTWIPECHDWGSYWRPSIDAFRSPWSGVWLDADIGLSELVVSWDLFSFTDSTSQNANIKGETAFAPVFNVSLTVKQ